MPRSRRKGQSADELERGNTGAFGYLRSVARERQAFNRWEIGLAVFLVGPLLYASFHANGRSARAQARTDPTAASLDAFEKVWRADLARAGKPTANLTYRVRQRPCIPELFDHGLVPAPTGPDCAKKRGEIGILPANGDPAIAYAYDPATETVVRREFADARARVPASTRTVLEHVMAFDVAFDGGGVAVEPTQFRRVRLYVLVHGAQRDEAYDNPNLASQSAYFHHRTAERTWVVDVTSPSTNP